MSAQIKGVGELLLASGADVLLVTQMRVDVPLEVASLRESLSTTFKITHHLSFLGV